MTLTPTDVPNGSSTRLDVRSLSKPPSTSTTSINFSHCIGRGWKWWFSAQRNSSRRGWGGWGEGKIFHISPTKPWKRGKMEQLLRNSIPSNLIIILIMRMTKFTLPTTTPTLTPNLPPICKKKKSKSSPFMAAEPSAQPSPKIKFQLSPSQITPS